MTRNHQWRSGSSPPAPTASARCSSIQNALAFPPAVYFLLWILLLQYPKCFGTPNSVAGPGIDVLPDTRTPKSPNFCSLLMAPLFLRCTAAQNSWQSTPPSASPPLSGVTVMTKRSGGTGTREMRTGAGQRALSPGAWSGGLHCCCGLLPVPRACASTEGLRQDRRFVHTLRVCARTKDLC